jgi:hypothetical protein
MLKWKETWNLLLEAKNTLALKDFHNLHLNVFLLQKPLTLLPYYRIL